MTWNEGNIEKILLCVLRNALWGSPLPTGSISEKRFYELMQIAEKQAVIGMVAATLMKSGISLLPKESAMLFVFAQKVEQKNINVSNGLQALCNLLQSHNIPLLVVKGQTIGRLYPKPLSRMAGDIDFYIDQKHWQQAINLITDKWQVTPEADEGGEQHVSFSKNGVLFEMHYNLYKLFNKSNQKFFNSLLDYNISHPQLVNVPNVKVLVPTLQEVDNLVYTFLHLYRHLVELGVGLRQFSDVAVLIKNIDWTEEKRKRLIDELCALDFLNAFKAVCAVLVDELGLQENALPVKLSKKDHSRSRDFLPIIFKGGNFGYYGLKEPLRNGKKYYIDAFFRKMRRYINFYTLSPKETRANIMISVPRKIILAISGKLSLLVAILTVTTLLTSCGADKYYKQGEKHLALGEYFDAAAAYKQAYQKTPPKEREQRGKIAKKMAYCYSKSLQTGKAIAAWRNVERYHQDDSTSHLILAQQLMKNGNYKEAAEEFQIASDSMPGNKLAKDGIKSANNAPKIKQLGSRYTVKRIDAFNSRRADYSPMLFGDDYDQIYFTSTRNESEGEDLSGITGTKPGDIFFSQKDDKGKWSKPEAVGGGLNTAYDEGACCFSTDGREMYLTQCVTDPTSPRYAQIVKSDRSDAAWGKATEVELTKDTLSSYAHPAISPDGEWLYFVSDMPGGMGGLDIWRVRITAHGFGGVENLGAPINTAGDEAFPTFRPNGDLYFSSNGQPGLGGYDIFIAHTGKDKKLTISHPGYPLNSQGDDFGMTFEGVHNRGYFSSNRNDARGFDHIYSFENPEIIQTVKGWVYEMDGYELPQAQVYCVGDDGTNEKITLKSDGSFTKTMDPGVSYLFMASCKGYLNHKEEVIAMKNPKESKDTTLQFALANISAPTLIDNIFYDFDKATLRDSSKTALDNLVNILKENPNVTIELSAHCDYKGSAEYNKRLSQRRAESVVNYLIAHGIAADRLTPVGYGKERPRTVKKKLTEKYPWLKEGDVLTEGYIQKLKDPKQQDICNQLNRRTEFTVLRTTYGLFDKDGKLKQMPKPRQQKQENDDFIVY